MLKQHVSNLRRENSVLQDKVKVYRLQFDSRCDKNEYYSKHLYLRVKNIKKSENKTSEVVLESIRKLFDEANVVIPVACIDRAHHVSETNDTAARPATMGGCGPMVMVPSTFLRSKTNKQKKRKQRKKRNSFKAETVKSLSPTSKCHCFSHSRSYRIQIFSCRSTVTAGNTFQCSMAPLLWNPFRRPWVIVSFITFRHRTMFCCNRKALKLE